MDLNACIDYHLLKQILPGFHRDKLQNFTNIMRELATIEVQNNTQGA